MKPRFICFVIFVCTIIMGCATNSAESFYNQGMDCYKSKDYQNAFAYFSKAAELGYSKAQNRCGIMYLKGIGVQQNYANAYTYFVQGYNNNQNKASAYWIGYCYYTGYGVNQNFNQAYNFFKYAADQGQPLANRYLGMMYFFGDGLPKNYNNAVYYFNIAANEGDSFGQMFMGICYYDGIGVVKDASLGRSYLEKSAQKGNKLAQELLNDYESWWRKGYNLIDKVADYIPYFGTGWRIGQALSGD